jgi:hypothetical protein
MQKCSCCGRDNDDSQSRCAGCGTPFGELPTTFEQRVSIYLAVGGLAQLLSRALLDTGKDAGSMLAGITLLVVGAGVIVYGCRRYAANKGYHKSLGWLGLLSCVGIITLVLLPNRRKGTLEFDQDAAPKPTNESQSSQTDRNLPDQVQTHN